MLTFRLNREREADMEWLEIIEELAEIEAVLIEIGETVDEGNN